MMVVDLEPVGKPKVGLAPSGPARGIGLIGQGSAGCSALLAWTSPGAGSRGGLWRALPQGRRRTPFARTNIGERWLDGDAAIGGEPFGPSSEPLGRHPCSLPMTTE